MAFLTGNDSKIEYKVTSISELYVHSSINFLVGNKEILNPKLSKNGFCILEDVDYPLSSLIKNVLQSNKPESFMDVDGSAAIAFYPNQTSPFLPTFEALTQEDDGCFTIAFIINEFPVDGKHTRDCTGFSFFITIDNRATLEKFLDNILEEEKLAKRM